LLFFLPQVASAIWYLHDCDIIYRDLKGDNVLVWSLDESSLLNVKLSDYGISCFATPQGVAGEEGTPGYQAPEIRTGVGYDEKVMEEESCNSQDVMLFKHYRDVQQLCVFAQAREGNLAFPGLYGR